MSKIFLMILALAVLALAVGLVLAAMEPGAVEVHRAAHLAVPPGGESRAHALGL